MDMINNRATLSSQWEVQSTVALTQPMSKDGSYVLNYYQSFIAAREWCIFCQFWGRAFSRKFNRDRHEAAHRSKRFDDEQGMTSFLNDKESIE